MLVARGRRVSILPESRLPEPGTDQGYHSGRVDDVIPLPATRTYEEYKTREIPISGIRAKS